MATDERELAEVMRAMGRTRNDRAVVESLRGGRARALFSGQPVARYLYRLACGHVTSVVSVALDPRRTTDLYCAECKTRQGIIEHLTER